MTTKRREELFDVLEVPIAKPHTVRVIAEDKNKENADAIVSMAVMRRGVENHIFAKAPAGKYANGDEWTGA